MSLVPFDRLPDDARVWCFAADPAPGPREAAKLLDEMRDFVEAWTAHREALRAGLDWRLHRFLCVAVDESGAGASGCSIDALTDRLRRLESDLGTSMLDASPVWFRDGSGTIRAVPREAFREMAGRGEVGPDTTVFDLTVARLGDLRAGRMEKPARESWHARLL
ncbi:MAG: hypothetical protein R6X22_13125 [Gemmatimonadota bacterium]|jgi:hypothetical protein